MNAFIILALCVATIFAQQPSGHVMTPCATPATATQCATFKACMPARTGSGSGTHQKPAPGVTPSAQQTAQWQAMKSQMQACLSSAGITTMSCLKSCRQQSG